MKGQRIIFVLGNLELGGAERQALLLARHLSRAEQATVEVWGFNKSGPVADICEQHDIRWRVEPLSSPCRRGELDAASCGDTRRRLHDTPPAQASGSRFCTLLSLRAHAQRLDVAAFR